MRRYWFIIGFVLATLCGCSATTGTGGDGGEAIAKTTLKDLEPAIEARQFFNDANCVVWNEGFPLSELKQFCEDLYRAGAPKVMFGNAEDFEGKKLSALFAAELPQDKVARDRIIKVWNDKLGEDSDSAVKPDDDTDYLELTLD